MNAEVTLAVHTVYNGSTWKVLVNKTYLDIAFTEKGDAKSFCRRLRRCMPQIAEAISKELEV